MCSVQATLSNGHLFVGLLFSLLPLFDSLKDGHLSQQDVHPKVPVLERVETIRTR